MAKAKGQSGKAVASPPEYLVAVYSAPKDGAGTIIIPAPNPNELNMRDLILADGIPAVIHVAWQSDVNFARYVQDGQILVDFSSEIPTGKKPELDPTFSELMDDKQRQFALNFLELWPSDQFKQAATVGRHINPKTGLPISRDSAVTVTFLKNKHIVTLSATLDLEKRWKGRPEVVEFLSGEISFIESI